MRQLGESLNAVALCYLILTLFRHSFDSKKRLWWRPLTRTKTIDSYCAVTFTYLLTILRLFIGVKDFNYEIPLTTSQQTTGRKLLEILKAGSDDEQTETALHQFLSALFETQEESGPPAPYNFTFNKYLALRALRDDGSFIAPEIVPTIYAKMVNLAFCVAMQDAHMKKDVHPQGMIG